MLLPPARVGVSAEREPADPRRQVLAREKTSRKGSPDRSSSLSDCSASTSYGGSMHREVSRERTASLRDEELLEAREPPAPRRCQPPGACFGFHHPVRIFRSDDSETICLTDRTSPAISERDCAYLCPFRARRCDALWREASTSMDDWSAGESPISTRKHVARRVFPRLAIEVVELEHARRNPGALAWMNDPGPIKVAGWTRQAGEVSFAARTSRARLPDLE